LVSARADTPVIIDACDVEDHGCICGAGAGSSQRAVDTCDASEVYSEIVCCTKHTRPVCPIDVDLDWRSAGGEGKAAIAGFEVDSRLAERLDSMDKCGEAGREGEQAQQRTA
jgi:hypothetical protein